jgi:hypothetical protein
MGTSSETDPEKPSVPLGFSVSPAPDTFLIAQAITTKL